jgi:hypothetical protein
MTAPPKSIVTLDRHLPAALFGPRRITNTAEVHSGFFPGGRIPLLISPTTTLSATRLRWAGAERDGRHVFVRQGAPIDFEVLDKLLPFAARRTITPILGDLIPGSSWGSNLHNLLTRRTWDELRRRTFLKTGFRCETCGTDRNLECHELWEYHEPLPEYMARHACGVQRLIRLMALCDDCHETHHLGLAEQRGRGPIAFGRIGAYNRWTAAHLDQYRDFLITRYERRCQCFWAIDISCAASIPLIVSKKWRLEDDGFLSATTKTGPSQTLILGSGWWREGVFYPPLSPLAACLEDPPAITAEWKYIARHTLGGTPAYTCIRKPPSIMN